MLNLCYMYSSLRFELHITSADPFCLLFGLYRKCQLLWSGLRIKNCLSYCINVTAAYCGNSNVNLPWGLGILVCLAAVLASWGQTFWWTFRTTVHRIACNSSATSESKGWCDWNVFRTVEALKQQSIKVTIVSWLNWEGLEHALQNGMIQ